MPLKDSLFWLKFLALSAAGLIAGFVNLSAVEGLTLFFFTDIVVGVAFLTWKKEAISNLGLYKAFREFFMTSFLAFLLMWTLALNLTSGGVALYLANPAPGVQELRPVVPRQGFPYNSILVIEVTEDGITAALGACASVDGGTIQLPNVTASATEGGILLTLEEALVEGGMLDKGWIKFELANRTIKVTLPTGESTTLAVGESASIALEGYDLRLSSSESPSGATVKAVLGPIPLADADYVETGLGTVISYTRIVNGRFCVFSPDVDQFKRTVRVEDAYVVMRD